MQKKLLVSIPAYNEESNIGRVLDDILNSPLRDSFDLLVVDDGSTDDTAKVCKQKGVFVITHVFNAGYGAALKTAYKYAVEYGYEYIVQMDADGQHDVKNIEILYERLTTGEKRPDIVIGSRFLEGSVSFYTPWHKRVVISVINMLIKAAAKRKITDPTSGLQGLSRHAFGYYAQFNRFAIDYPDANMVIQMLINGFDIVEIPAIMHARTSGTSMHHGIYKPIKYIVKMLISIFVTYLRESQVVKRQQKMQRRAEKCGSETN